MKKMGDCQWCGNVAPLVKAHVIPEAFWTERRDDEGPARILTNKPGVFPKKSYIGVYDHGILCRACEVNFGKWDDEGVRVLLRSGHKLTEVRNGAEIVGWTLDRQEFDYGRLHCFFVSVLWRASVSTQDYYEHVRLGTLQARAKKWLESGEPARNSTFSVRLGRWRDRQQGSAYPEAMMSPTRGNEFGAYAYKVYFGRTFAYVKASKEPFRSGMSETVLCPDRDLMFHAEDFDGSREYGRLLRMARDAAS